MADRARALGLRFGELQPGPHNGLTDVPGVRVGHTTIEIGHGPLVVGQGPVRTGVTVIVPGDFDPYLERPAAGAFVLNGAGEVHGLTQLVEWGHLESSIALTNTFSVGVVADALVDELRTRHPEVGRSGDVAIPIVGECDDSWLNDIAGRHVRAEHVLAALSGATSGPVVEGSVGAGTGTLCYGLKGGIGTASRRLSAGSGGFTLGALIQTNFGRLDELRLGGRCVGEDLAQHLGYFPARRRDYGSFIVVLATDAPLTSSQLSRLCKRAALGAGRTGSHASHGSGEILLAFSTTHRLPRSSSTPTYLQSLVHDDFLDPLFRAAADATEEAVINALCAAEECVGANDHHVPALPHGRVRFLSEKA